MKLIAKIESCNNCYVGWIDSIKGLVVEAGSIEDVLHELLISLKVKMSYDYGIDINHIEHKHFTSKEDADEFEKSLEMSNGIGTKEINLDMDFA